MSYMRDVVLDLQPPDQDEMPIGDGGGTPHYTISLVEEVELSPHKWLLQHARTKEKYGWFECPDDALEWAQDLQPGKWAADIQFDTDTTVRMTSATWRSRNGLRDEIEDDN